MTRLIIMPKLDNDGVWSQKYFDSFTLSPRVLYDTLIIGQRGCSTLSFSLRFLYILYIFFFVGQPQEV